MLRIPSRSFMDKSGHLNLSRVYLQDLQCGADPSTVQPPIMTEALREWMQDVMCFIFRPEVLATRKHKTPPYIRSIYCASEACAIVKCYEDDPRCSYNGVEDMSLANFGMEPGMTWESLMSGTSTAAPSVAQSSPLWNAPHIYQRTSGFYMNPQDSLLLKEALQVG